MFLSHCTLPAAARGVSARHRTMRLLATPAAAALSSILTPARATPVQVLPTGFPDPAVLNDPRSGHWYAFATAGNGRKVQIARGPAGPRCPPRHGILGRQHGHLGPGRAAPRRQQALRDVLLRAVRSGHEAPLRRRSDG